MSGEPNQFVFDWGARPALGAEDFLVGESNAAAVALVDRWPDWSMSSALVVGPPQSGKSHLAHVWQLRSSATMLSAQELSEEHVPKLMHRPALVIEDIDREIGSEQALFHLLNLAREQRTSLLLTSRAPAGELDVALPDLRSRLRALAVTAIGAPDPTCWRRYWSSCWRIARSPSRLRSSTTWPARSTGPLLPPSVSSRRSTGYRWRPAARLRGYWPGRP